MVLVFGYLTEAGKQYWANRVRLMKVFLYELESSCTCLEFLYRHFYYLLYGRLKKKQDYYIKCHPYKCYCVVCYRDSYDFLVVVFCSNSVLASVSHIFILSSLPIISELARGGANVFLWLLL